MSKKKRVGLMGGIFNPIHLGHMLVAENACEALDLDEVVFVPCGKSHMKECALDAKTRISMIGEGIIDNSHFALSTLEVDREGFSYSYETIEWFKKQNPDTEYYFIMGADALMKFEQWKNPDRILKEVPVVVAPRPTVSTEMLEAKINELKSKYEYADFRLLSMSGVDISSSMIRKKVKEGRSIRYLVHYKVIEYIKRNHIYMDEEE